MESNSFLNQSWRSKRFKVDGRQSNWTSRNTLRLSGEKNWPDFKNMELLDHTRVCKSQNISRQFDLE